VEQDLEKNMAQFLEKWSPLRKYRKPVCDELRNMARPSIHMYCPQCESEQTFINLGSDARKGNHSSLFERVGEPFEVLLARYLCAGCKEFGRFFVLETGEVDGNQFIRKIGQKPDWEAVIEPRLLDTLGLHEAIFRRGVDCESSGYGIGAFAYYRRVVEDILDELLDRIPPLLEEEAREEYIEALKKTKSMPVAQDKIELVKDLLPQTLRRGGINPLDVLYDALSEGLHARTDDECLDLAAIIRESLSYLIDELQRATNAERQFTESMRRLLGKRACSKTSGA